jgi:hypothetical protein
MGIIDDPQKGDYVFDVGLFKEPKTTSDFKRYSPAGEFHLYFHRVVMGPIENSDLAKRYTFFLLEFRDPLGDEFRLLDDVPRRRQNGDDTAGSDTLQCFFKLIFITRD